MMLDLSEFRATRDYFQYLRRIEVLPQLNTRKTALERQIKALRILADWMAILPTKGLAWKDFTKALTHNHRRESLLAAAVEIGWEYADVCGQVSAIEGEHEALTARVPSAWKADVFTIADAGAEPLAGSEAA